MSIFNFKGIFKFKGALARLDDEFDYLLKEFGASLQNNKIKDEREELNRQLSSSKLYSSGIHLTYKLIYGDHHGTSYNDTYIPSPFTSSNTTYTCNHHL